MKGIFILIFVAAVVFAGIQFYSNRAGFLRSRPEVSINGGHPIAVRIADTPAEREQGLSGSEPMDPNEGMLFLFDAPGPLAFWMKDMRFSIDIIWIGSDWNIVDITHSIAPETYPATFSPTHDAQYVLEVPAGFAKRRDVEIGQSVSFQQ
jgi:uncharacterized protein